MGATYCNTCCKEKTQAGHLQIPNQQDLNIPNNQFARPVRQIVELSAKVKDIYFRYRTPHIPQKKGTKLHFFYLFHLAAYYQGDWKEGVPHGSGKLIYDDGSLYEGCFNMGQAECRTALFIRPDGSFYKGQVKHNCAIGYGQMVNERQVDKVIYKGYWKDNLPQGEGRQIFGMGTAHYDGQFRGGKKNGKGIYYWNARQYYIGQFVQNKMQGNGQYHCRQFSYKGKFLNGKRNGEGVLKNYSNGWTYQGFFIDGKMEGKGKYIWPDGTIFEGQFKDNQRTQQGKITLKDGKIVINPPIRPKNGKKFEDNAIHIVIPQTEIPIQGYDQ